MKLNVKQVKKEIENNVNGCKVLEAKYDILHNCTTITVELSNGKKKYIDFVGKEVNEIEVEHICEHLNKEC